MAASTAKTVAAYLASLPPDRRAAIAAVRATILANLPAGYEEGMLYGMIGYYVPLSRYPITYNGQPLYIAALASQKGYMSVYLLSVYGDREIERWFRAGFAKAGKKLDMGKSCVRFKTLDALPLPLIGEVIAKVSVEQYLVHYEATMRTSTKSTAAKKKVPAAAAAGKKAPASAKKPRLGPGGPAALAQRAPR